MSARMIDVLEERHAALERGNVFQQAEMGKHFAKAVMAYLRDVENRLQALERKP